MGDTAVIPKPRTLLRVEPESELCFRGPFTQVVTSNLKLINPSDKKICFKVKTTAPRRYCVRPNNGILAPKSSVDVVLRLQPLDSPDTESTKHKFMVQSLVAPDDNINSLDKLWRAATSDQLMYTKLRCVFENEKGEKVSNEEINKLTTAPSNAATPRPPAAVDNRNGLVEDETRRLRFEVDKLRQENRKLKEAEGRLRKLSPKDAGNRVIDAQDDKAMYPSWVYIFVALILGLFFGKFIL